MFDSDNTKFSKSFRHTENKNVDNFSPGLTKVRQGNNSDSSPLYCTRFYIFIHIIYNSEYFPFYTTVYHFRPQAHSQNCVNNFAEVNETTKVQPLPLFFVWLLLSELISKFQ